MTQFNITVNDKPAQIALTNFTERVLRHPEPLLNIAGEVMRGSIETTFRTQGSPSGSWPALSPSTLRRGRGGLGRKILIQSGRLKNTITYQVAGNTLTIGSNLKYAGIQQHGGEAGRKGPFKKKHGRRARIPARPYLVFRPEDPDKIGTAMDRYIESGAAAEGLK
jgi:phage virion morphogenesis protein